MIEEIANGILLQHGRYAEEQRALVCGHEWCILIDAPRYFDEADELKNIALQRTSKGVKFAIITHGHLDHIESLQTFPGVTVVSTWAAREYMKGKGQEELDKMKQDDEELRRVTQVLPSVVFTGEGIILDDTGRSLRCIPVPGHSDDSQMVYIEPEGILFSGDTLSAVVPPYFPDGNSVHLQETLTKLADFGAEILVPGHGPILRGEQISKEAEEAVSYLETLRNLVRKGMESGKKAEELQDEIKWEDCSSKSLPPEEYLQYHRENIGNMVQEISGEMTAMKASPAWHV